MEDMGNKGNEIIMTSLNFNLTFNKFNQKMSFIRPIVFDGVFFFNEASREENDLINFMQRVLNEKYFEYVSNTTSQASWFILDSVSKKFDVGQYE